MKYKDYQEVLGLPRWATRDDIKRTYRKPARKYHPDLSKLDDAESRFSEFFEALFRGEHAGHVTSTRARIFQVIHHERIEHCLAQMPDRRGAGGVHATRIVPGIRRF